MRKWYIPLAVAGVGGLGAFLLSETGRRAMRWFGHCVRWNAQGMLEWNAAAEAELKAIQSALAALADTLEPRTECGR